MILVTTCCVCSVASVPTSYLLSVDKQSLILKVMLVGTVLKLGLDYYLVSNYGLLGASVAFSIAFVFMFLANLIIAMKHLKVKFPWLQMIKLTFSVLVGIGAIYFILDVEYPLVRLSVCGIIFAVVYFTMTLLLRCWRKQEISIVREKLAATKLSILKPVDALLAWAAK